MLKLAQVGPGSVAGLMAAWQLPLGVGFWADLHSLRSDWIPKHVPLQLLHILLSGKPSKNVPKLDPPCQEDFYPSQWGLPFFHAEWCSMEWGT